MIHLEATEDAELLRSIVTHPKIWAHVSDDYAPAPELWIPPFGPNVRWVVARDEEELLGCFMLHADNAICWEVHICVLPLAWGPRAREAAQALIEWVWEHTPARRLIARVPESNRLALRFAKQAGLTEYGVNPASVLRNGTLETQTLLGLSK